MIKDDCKTSLNLKRVTLSEVVAEAIKLNVKKMLHNNLFSLSV
jgi:hypothetical protein